jgi:tetratricopeptide (TPR) repeat protein
LLALSASGCVSHLRQAKLFYSQGQEFSRAYETGNAAASFKKALLEADLEAKKNPSAQAFMLKGLAEASLEMWPEAEASFLKAHALGFESGEEWAADVSLLGLASSFHELGLKDQAYRVWAILVEKSKFKPVLLAAAQKYTDLALARAAEAGGSKKGGNLTETIKTIDKLINRDFACGYYHYLRSQIGIHLADYRTSYQEAVTARELGLSSEKVFRDNDLQIIFCLEKLKESLPPGEWQEFSIRHAVWVKRWGWKDGRTPAWKQR